MIESVKKYFEEKYSDLRYDEESREFLAFTNIKDEYNAFLTSGTISLKYKNIIEVSGKDARDFLNRITTSDFTKSIKNNVIHTFFLNEKGKIIDLCKVVDYSDFFLVITNKFNFEKIFFWLKKYIIQDDVTIKVRDDLFQFELLGKNIESFLILLFGNNFFKIEKNSLHKYDDTDLKFEYFKDQIRPDYNSYNILISDNLVLSLIDKIQNNSELFHNKFIGTETISYILFMLGLPISENELNISNTPFDLELTEFISFSKGCYIGQEIIAKIRAYKKLNPKFVGFLIKSKLKDELLDRNIYTDDKIVGIITNHLFLENEQLTLALGSLFDSNYVINENLKINNQGSYLKITPKILPFIKL